MGSGNGLQSRNDDRLKRFEIAGKDRVWHWADAKIVDTNSVVVSSDNVPAPIAVRYAWAANPEGANLVNHEGLPASVFRTDDWDDVEAVVKAKVDTQQLAHRMLAKQLQEIRIKQETLEPGNDEFKQFTKKRIELLKKFRAMAPVK